MTRIVFVCLGNICRSPTAEGVMNHLLKERTLTHKVYIDSAGTSGWHAGDSADHRSRETAKRYGFDLESRSRKFTVDDFRNFDYIIAMDKSNKQNILQLSSSEEDREKVYLFRNFDVNSPPNSDVPDPYYGGEKGFDHVFSICFAGCKGLLKHLEEQGRL